MQLFMLLLALCSPALAARVQLQVESDQLVVGQSVALELQVVDGRADGVPDVPVEDGLALRYRGQGQSMSIIGMKTTRVVRYTYQLTALREGTFKVGPAQVDLGGSIIRHPAITIEVARSADDGPPMAEVSTELTDSRPFVGEVVTYKVAFRRREEARNIRWTPPTTPGFVAEPSAELEQADRSQISNGVEESVLDIMLPLRATAAGVHTLSPAVIIADMPAPPDPRTGRRPQDVFGRYRTRTTSLSGQPIEAEIRALPAAGRPDDFSGLVGRFAIRAVPSARSVAVGDTVTLKVVLEGSGVLAGFKLPPVGSQDDFRIYDDAPVVESAAGPTGLLSRATFNRALVPLREGTLQLPPVKLTVFDPDAEAYVTLESPPVQVKVSGGQVEGDVQSFTDGSADSRREVEALGDDILPAPGAASVADRTVMGSLPLMIGVPLLPLLAAVGLSVRGLYARRQLDPWTELARRPLPSEPQERLAVLEALFREAAGLKLGCPPAAVDRGRLEPLGATALGLYSDLETARYGGGAAAGLVDRVMAWIAARGEA